MSSSRSNGNKKALDKLRKSDLYTVFLKYPAGSDPAAQEFCDLFGNPVLASHEDSFGRSSGLHTVQTMRDLRAIEHTRLAHGDSVQLLGYRRANGRGGGLFVWDRQMEFNDNGGTIVKPNSVNPGNTGRWVRPGHGSCRSTVHVHWFGAIPEDLNDGLMSVPEMTTAIQNAFKPNTDPASNRWSAGVVFESQGQGGLSISDRYYTVNMPIEVDGACEITGSNHPFSFEERNVPKIRLTGTTTVSALGRDIKKRAVLYVRNNLSTLNNAKGHTKGFSCKGIALINNNSSLVADTYGIYFHSTNASRIDLNVAVYNAAYAIRSKGSLFYTQGSVYAQRCVFGVYCGGDNRFECTSINLKIFCFHVYRPFTCQSELFYSHITITADHCGVSAYKNGDLGAQDAGTLTPIIAAVQRKCFGNIFTIGNEMTDAMVFYFSGRQDAFDTNLQSTINYSGIQEWLWYERPGLTDVYTENDGLCPVSKQAIFSVGKGGGQLVVNNYNNLASDTLPTTSSLTALGDNPNSVMIVFDNAMIVKKRYRRFKSSEKFTNNINEHVYAINTLPGNFEIFN